MKRDLAKLLIAIIWTAVAVSGNAQSLTGVWKANDGGTYQIRQEGGQVWWYGRSADGGRTWQNVFRGGITQGNEVVGDWADVPPGRARGSGKLRLQVRNSQRLVRVSATGALGASEWVLSSPSVRDDRGQAIVRDHRGQTVVRDHRGQTVVRDHRGQTAKVPARPGQPRPAPQFDQCARDLAAVLAQITSRTALPSDYSVTPDAGGKADGVVQIPESVAAWFERYATVLERVMRRLAGDEAVNEYLTAERSWGLTTNLQRVDKRLEAIALMLQ